MKWQTIFPNEENLKRLTPGMKKILADIYKRQQQNLPPLPYGTTRFSTGLIRRGLAYIAEYPIAGKKMECLFLTDEGKQKVNMLEEPGAA